MRGDAFAAPARARRRARAARTCVRIGERDSRRDPEVARVIVKSFAASVRDAGEARAYLEEVRAEYLRQYEEATRA
jgi:hypothetical protein